MLVKHRETKSGLSQLKRQFLDSLGPGEKTGEECESWSLAKMYHRQQRRIHTQPVEYLGIKSPSQKMTTRLRPIPASDIATVPMPPFHPVVCI